jgi:hypothetical protein
MTVPAEAKSFDYTPECFDGIEGAPSFVLRYGTRRDRHAYQDQIALRNLRSHDTEDFQRAVIDELKLDWASDEMNIDDIVDAVERYYSAMAAFVTEQNEWIGLARKYLADNPDAGTTVEDVKEHLPPEPELEFDAHERRKVESLIDDVESNSLRIGKMKRDNQRRERELRRISIALLLQETSLPVELKRDREKVLTDDSVDAIENALEKFFTDLVPNAEGLNTAFAQLGLKALLSFYLTGDEEKNSASPPSITSEDNGSMESGKIVSTTETSASKASASDPTPAKSSAKPTPGSSNSLSAVETDSEASAGQTVEAS